MKEFTVGKNDANQRLDRWLSKNLPLLPAPLAQKYIRLKRVKLNGKGAKRDTRLVKGDLLQLYINDEFFDTPTPENAFLSVFKPQLDIVYEDENLLLVNKRPGLVVHPDEQERVNTLITHIQAYLYQKKEWSPYWENSFAPALCNRIDRNTGGIVIAAKNADPVVKDTSEAADNLRLEVCKESADLLYHLSVLWEDTGVTVNDVMKVLEERSHVKGNKKTVGHLDKTF